MAGRGGEIDYQIEVLTPSGESEKIDVYGRLRLEAAWCIVFLDDAGGATHVTFAIPRERVLAVWGEGDPSE